MKMYQQIEQTMAALIRSENSGNTQWVDKWSELLDSLEKELPSGSGFDAGTQIDIDDARDQMEKHGRITRIVMSTAFHHMDECGSYCGWTEHTVRVYPDFASGFRLVITGQNKRQIKDYIGGVIDDVLISYYVR